MSTNPFIGTNPFSGGGGGGGTVAWFTDTAARDAYYTEHQDALKPGISVGIGDPVVVYTWDGSAWIEGALAFKGDKGDKGDAGPEGVKGDAGDALSEEQKQQLASLDEAVSTAQAASNSASGSASQAQTSASDALVSAGQAGTWASTAQAAADAAASSASEIEAGDYAHVQELLAHVQDLSVHVTTAEKASLGNIPGLVDGMTSISTALGTTTANLDTLEATVNDKHIPTDRYRWSDFYETQLQLYEQIAASQGLKPDFDNATTVPQGTPYAVSAPQGGLLTVKALNENGFYTAVTIVGRAGWNSDGLIEGISITKYFRLLNGDQVQVDNASMATLTPAIEDPDNATRLAMQGMQDEIANNKKALLDINARLSNKKPSGTMTDIESASQGAGYTVPENNGLGGRIHGKGINALLGSTGVVDVQNAEGTIEVYNNLGLLSLLSPVPVLVEDVMDGDIVTSSGMSELFYEPYIAG